MSSKHGNSDLSSTHAHTQARAHELHTSHRCGNTPRNTTPQHTYEYLTTSAKCKCGLLHAIKCTVNNQPGWQPAGSEATPCDSCGHQTVCPDTQTSNDAVLWLTLRLASCGCPRRLCASAFKLAHTDSPHTTLLWLPSADKSRARQMQPGCLLTPVPPIVVIQRVQAQRLQS